MKEELNIFINTIFDVLPIAGLLALFQIFVIKKRIPNLKAVLYGFILVILGLSVFLIGLEKALFPIGDTMARQLVDIRFVGEDPQWYSYFWIYLFAGMIGFSATIAEPALIAVSIKANEVSGKILHAYGLRIAVAIGVAIALVLGAFRIVTGLPLVYLIIGSYTIVIVLTIFANKNFIGLAYDSGGVTTSTITVPIVAALGLGLAEVIPGRNPIIDGFGMIALACLFPIITVLLYGKVMEWWAKRKKSKVDTSS